MKNLQNILADLAVTNDKELSQYVDDNYSNQASIPLKIIRRCDLNIDTENRIYENKVEYSKTIFDLKELTILNSSNVTFQDCIFIGSLRISSKDKNTPTKIVLDTALVKDKLNISGAFNISKCNISYVNCPELNILNNDFISKLSISSCKIGLLEIYNTKIEEFDSSFNKLDHFRCFLTDFVKVNFPNSQINLTNHKLHFREPKKKNNKKQNDNFLFGTNIDYSKLSKLERLQIANETSRFLLLHSDYYLDPVGQARIKYIAGLSAISNPFKRLIYQTFGGLIVPYRIVILMLTIILLFSFIYYFSGINFIISNTQRTLCFAESIYFSGISFSTIGYGDISPLHFLRYISIIEGVIGILLSSAFLISLTRKYID